MQLAFLAPVGILAQRTFFAKLRERLSQVFDVKVIMVMSVYETEGNPLLKTIVAFV